MSDGPDFAEAAALIGDPARAQMLAALLDGCAWTATELAYEASIAPSTASTHLAKLLTGGLITNVKQGRHRYFRLAGPDVGAAIEALMNLATRTAPTKRRPGPRDERMRYARTCYDHLAGEMAVSLFAYMVRHAWLSSTSNGWALTAVGTAELERTTGHPLPSPTSKGRTCLDWSERKEHLGGPLGHLLLSGLLEGGLVHRGPGRVVTLTELGVQRLGGLIGVKVSQTGIPVSASAFEDHSTQS